MSDPNTPPTIRKMSSEEWERIQDDLAKDTGVYNSNNIKVERKDTLVKENIFESVQLRLGSGYSSKTEASLVKELQKNMTLESMELMVN